MSATFFREEYTKSICVGADGFCFTMPDGSRRKAIRGPFTIIPGINISQEDAETIFRAVFPDAYEKAVLTDVVSKFRSTLVYGADKTTLEMPDFGHDGVHSHLWHFIESIGNQSGRTICVLRNDDASDILAFDENRIVYLNTLYTQEPYNLLYCISRVWKDNGFKSSTDRICLYGFDAESSIIRNLKQLTGEDTICVL